MKIRIIALFCLAIMCISFVGCSDDIKLPVDYPDSKWTCSVADISFSVSQDRKVTDATMVNKNGETIDISLVFTEMDEGKVSITNADESEVYLSGTCSYDADGFTVKVTDIYNTDLEITSTKLVFERS